MYWKPDPLLYPPYLRNRIKRNRGIEQGSRYVPWLKVRDVPSHGTSAVIQGIRSGRPHHLLSELEAIYFFLIERRTTTVDIREQWPILDIDRTLELCSVFGVKHKFRKGFPEPFTVDFLITEQIDGQLKQRAASIKSPADALDPHVRQRLAVEHAWCEERNVPWTLVDTSNFSKTMLANLRFMRAWFRHRHESDPLLVGRFLQKFQAIYLPNSPLKEMLMTIGKSLHLSHTVAEDMFRFCAWHDHIKVSLIQPLSLEVPVVLRTETAND